MFEFLFKYPRDDYARSELIYTGDWPPWLLALLIIAALAGISWFLYRRRDFARPPQMLVVWVLQLAMLAVVIWLLQQPTLSTEQLRAGENVVAFVLDNSESMAYGESESRLQQAMRSLSATLADDSSLELSVQHYELADRARLVSSFLESEASGTGTSIAASLTDVLREARFSPLAAIVLSSDGADTTGGLSFSDLAEIAGFGVPVHTIAVGRESIPEDIELTDVMLPNRALPGSTITARVSIRHDAAASTRLKVYNGDDLLESLPVDLQPDTKNTTVWVNIKLADAGHHHIRFSVDGIPGEQELRNNSRSTLVEVADQKYRVLYFEGEPRWEYKFMRRALNDDEDLQIASLLRVSPNKFYRQGIESPEQLEKGFPTTRDELFAYDALIIGSVEAASLTDEQQAIIHDFVSERGGSLLMLAGPNGLGNGGWGQSRIADVLPVRLPPSTTDSFFRKKAAVVLTPQGADDRMLWLADTADANRVAWNKLPEVADYQVTGNLKPAAVTLLQVMTDIGQLPLLITQQFGRGHSYILASGGTWRWQMSMPVEDQSHETFWRQLLRALVAHAPSRVSLAASGDGGSTGVSLRAEFRDDAFRPIDDIGVTAIVTHQDGDSWSIDLLPSVDEPGVFQADVSPTASGNWYFEAVAERNGEPIEVARASIHYESGQAEYFNFRRDSRALQRLSEATGGRYLEPDELDALPDLLRYSSSGLTETNHRAIWDAPAVFLLLLLLKGGEWLLRRRWSTI
ncbi:MAG: hypothetical protein IH912_06050 [Proteobacteria bacterium]|nr:hypothetical protein [Pseudomonadota bacterium]